VAIAFFVLSALTALATLLALMAPRRPPIVGFFGWMLGLVPNELPFASMGLSVFLLALFGVLGAFDSALGVAAIVLLALAIVGDLVLARRCATAGPAVDRGLRDALGHGYEQQVDPALAASFRPGVPMGPVLLTPFLPRRRDVTRVRNLSYGDAGKRNLLDVYHHETTPPGCPVLVYLHGGAWVSGRKDNQGLPVVYHFASRGWVCVSANYRLCPDATFPDQLVDVKRVIAWVREHVHEYGGDPDQLFMSGGSAGGHLSALAALTPNDPTFQPGFEDVDTTLTAAMPLYGDYDWLDTNRERATRHLDRTKFFVDKIVKCTVDENRALWEQGSPLYHVRPDAPPFLVVHGTSDSLLLVEDTRHFVDALAAASRAPVAYVELPGGQHAFDGFQSVRCGHVINGMERFTAWVRSTRRASSVDRPVDLAVDLSDRRAHADEHDDGAEDRDDGPGR
jgi:acetyl esterase/lipase